MTQLQQIITAQAQQQNQLILEMKQVQGELAAVQSQQAISKSAVGAPSFETSKIKLDLLLKFMDKPSELMGWVFSVEQYCGMVGINEPTGMVKVAVSHLEGDVFTQWRQLAHPGTDFELGTLVWSEFQSELVNAFVNVDRELKLHRKLKSLKQQMSMTNYTKQFRQIVLELGVQAPDKSALLFMFTEGLKADVQMQVHLVRLQFLSEAEQVAERANMALFSSRQRLQQYGWQQRPRQSSWQYRQYGFQKPPPPPPHQGPVPIDLGALQDQGSNQQTPLQRTPAQQIMCYHCGKQGHMVKNCCVRLGGQSTQQQPNFAWVQQPGQYQQPYIYQQPPPQQFQPTFSHIYTQPPQYQVPQFQ